MKKRKWKWKWQFGSEDGRSESGESTQTDKQWTPPLNEEFDQGKRGRHDNAGSLDARCENNRFIIPFSNITVFSSSFKKKKWWKWKFGPKDKDLSALAQENAKETIQISILDQDQPQLPKSSEEKESKDDPR